MGHIMTEESRFVVAVRIIMYHACTLESTCEPTSPWCTLTSVIKCENAPKMLVMLAAVLTIVSFAVQDCLSTNSCGHLISYSRRRLWVSSTIIIMLSVTALHMPVKRRRMLCNSPTSTFPRLHSGFRMLTSVPAQRSMPHCCAA